MNKLKFNQAFNVIFLFTLLVFLIKQASEGIEMVIAKLADSRHFDSAIFKLNYQLYNFGSLSILLILVYCLLVSIDGRRKLNIDPFMITFYSLIMVIILTIVVVQFNLGLNIYYPNK